MSTIIGLVSTFRLPLQDADLVGFSHIKHVSIFIKSLLSSHYDVI